MKSSGVAAIVIIVLLVIVGFFVFSGGDETTTEQEETPTTVSQTQPAQDAQDTDEMIVEDTEETTPSDDEVMAEPDVTFVVTGENFKFVVDGEDNPDMIVSEGDLVRVEFTSTQGFHDWVVDEFNAATEKVRDTDGSTYVEFVAETAGEYEYYCSVGSHRANGMKGTLIVQ